VRETSIASNVFNLQKIVALLEFLYIFALHVVQYLFRSASTCFHRSCLPLHPAEITATMDDKNQNASYLETKVSDTPIADMKDPDRRGSAITDRNVITDNVHEHQLTFLEVARHHKALIWWSFYFAMCAVGWGFDAQVNGAMISVPSFRRDFGYAPFSWNIPWHN
jgi:hypothetical protein